MAFFVGTLCALILVCFGVQWKTARSTYNESKQGSGEFKKFQRTYITVYLLATGSCQMCQLSNDPNYSLVCLFTCQHGPDFDSHNEFGQFAVILTLATNTRV